MQNSGKGTEVKTIQITDQWIDKTKSKIDSLFEGKFEWMSKSLLAEFDPILEKLKNFCPKSELNLVKSLIEEGRATSKAVQSKDFVYNNFTKKLLNQPQSFISLAVMLQKTNFNLKFFQEATWMNIFKDVQKNSNNQKSVAQIAASGKFSVAPRVSYAEFHNISECATHFRALALTAEKVTEVILESVVELFPDNKLSTSTMMIWAKKDLSNYQDSIIDMLEEALPKGKTGLKNARYTKHKGNEERLPSQQ